MNFGFVDELELVSSDYLLNPTQVWGRCVARWYIFGFDFYKSKLKAFKGYYEEKNTSIQGYSPSHNTQMELQYFNKLMDDFSNLHIDVHLQRILTTFKKNGQKLMKNYNRY